MTYEEIIALIDEYIDYGGSLDKHGLAVALAAPTPTVAADAAAPTLQDVAVAVAQAIAAVKDLHDFVETRTQQPDERAAFEAWCKENGVDGVSDYATYVKCERAWMDRAVYPHAIKEPK